jgi:2-phospho-L-lactate guanylyltransferase
MILVPVKNLSAAKQRLSAILDQPTRTELAQAMLLDVLETLATWKNCPDVGIVTSDPFALQLAQRFHFTAIADSANRGETDAIEIATRFCESHGVDSTLVIPGDIPLIQSWELEKIFASAPTEGSVLAPGADGRGTNAIWRRPAGLFPARFGNDSFKPHYAAANATGKPCVVLSLPGIALDVDNPEDLHRLASAPGETRSQRLIRQWELADFPLAANE